ncbi:MAG: cbb3-type cytochrome c oxidase N-terminal domain-containing protein [Ignavibacteriaceae bacterium]
MIKNKKKFLILFFQTVGFIIFSTGNKVFAQTQTHEINPDVYDINLLIFSIIILIIFFAFIYYGTDKTIVRPKKISRILLKAKNYFIGLAPMEKEKDILMEHDFDGIKELDNRIPPWFNYLFYGTIIFGIIYMLDYHVLKTGKLPAQEYQEEMHMAALQRAELIKSGALVNENNVTLLTDASALSEGKDIFKVNCVPCHGENAQGIIGPNLTDRYWIHGGGIKNVFKTIKYGVPSKGMLTWEGKLNPREIQEVASYVISLQGTNPPNAKAPQGQIWEGTDSSKVTSK